MSQLEKLTLHASGNESASSNSVDFDGVKADGPAVLYIDTTVADGTNPTLDLTLEEKDPVSGQYHDTGLSITQIVATGVARYAIEYLYGAIYRLAWVIGGTVSPNFTFTAVLVAKDRG